MDRGFRGVVACRARLENHRLANATAAAIGTGGVVAVGELRYFSVIPKQAERAEGPLIRSACYTSYWCVNRMVASGVTTLR